MLIGLSFCFATGKDDIICWYCCGTVISKWNLKEDILIRHARQAPHCQLLITEKGQNWIDNVIEEHGEFQHLEQAVKTNVRFQCFYSSY